MTKEKLMNAYLHELKIKRYIELDFTVNDLLEAATRAGKKIQGYSKLDVNISPKEKLEYIRETRVTGSRERVKTILYNNKEEIITMYKSGASIKEIANAVGCAKSTLSNYLTEFGVKQRSRGRRKICG
jgi:DNA-binding NarL/FixJ family response regulator